MLPCLPSPAVVKPTWSGHVGGLRSAQGAALPDRMGSFQEVNGPGFTTGWEHRDRRT